MATQFTVEDMQKYMGEGYHCSQCVMMYAAEKLGLDRDLALRLSSGFGGGCCCGELCGAVSGAVMALGAKYGHSETKNASEKDPVLKAKVRDFEALFREKYGSLICKEILGYDISNPEERAKAEASGAKGNCPAMCAGACELLEQFL